MKNAIIWSTTFRVEQSRAARALLDWSREQLSTESGVPVRTIADFELGKAAPRRETLDAMRRALEAAGIEFIPENGGGFGVKFKERGAMVSQSDLQAFARAYASNKLAALGIHGREGPRFGFKFVWIERDGVDLMLDGAKLGSARWHQNGAFYDPPLPSADRKRTAEQEFDLWVELAYNRHAQGYPQQPA